MSGGARDLSGETHDGAGGSPQGLPPMDVASRVPRLLERLPDAGCDALVVTSSSNIRYLTGFTGSAGVLMVSDAESLITTDGRYATQVEEELAGSGAHARIEVGDPARQLEALSRAAGGLSRVGLEASHLSWARQRSLAAAMRDIEMVATTGLVEALRVIKDPGELARIEAAAAIADRALREVRAMVASGAAEKEIALALDFGMRRLGAVSSSFETIVASGPNAAKPHARPSSRRVGSGELTVVDFGAVVDGYCSDMTRTVSAAAPVTETESRMVEVVSESQRAGLASVRAGVEASAVDSACRSVIEEAGWGDAFVHGTGHGVGLDVHEAPAVAARSVDKLETGSVVTVEPGVYLPGVGGVRIEDTVVVTPLGCRVLTKAPKDLIVA